MLPISLISSFCLTVLGIGYGIATFMLEDAALGRAKEPKVFPALLAILLIVCSVVLLLREIKKFQQEKNADSSAKSALFTKTNGQILITLINGVIYALIFELIGYVFATFIFLMVQFFIFGGLKSLKTGAIISVIFSLLIFFTFDKLLGIVLPSSPLGFI